MGNCIAVSSAFLLLAILAFSDARHFRLPLSVNAAFVLVGLLGGGLAFGTTAADRMIGAGAGFLSLQGVALTYKYLRGRAGIGGGDPILFAGIGAWLGWQPLPVVILMASIFGLICAVVRGLIWPIVGQWQSQRLPLGTFMAAATLIVAGLELYEA